jgi:holo-[acyl-carrier protein] synthase
MEESMKEIIAGYLGTDAGSIQAGTLINRSAFGNSITLHRMYAKLAGEGIVVENYFDINTYGDLLAKTGTVNSTSLPAVQVSPVESSGGDEGIGIDIEIVAEMPEATDYREEKFYQMNFHPSEIAYCILQPQPRVSFAGLFAAKEAIVKADNTWGNQPFHNIVIRHRQNGKPYFGSMSISISHTSDTAIAVAVSKQKGMEISLTPVAATGGNPVVHFSALIAILLSLLALAFIFFHR